MNKIEIYENILSESEISTIWKEFLLSPNWTFSHKTDNNIDSNSFIWFLNLEDPFFTDCIFSKIKSVIGKNFNLQRVYANGQTFGMDGEVHIDSDRNDAYTFLYYPTEVWDLTWSGETVIIDKDGIVHNIYPKPNTGILFPSNWPHYGRGPSKSFDGIRITIAFKLYQCNQV